MALKTLKNIRGKILPLALAAGMALGSVSGCDPIYAQPEKPAAEAIQYYHRSPGREKHSGGKYVASSDIKDMFRDQKGALRYTEEGAIGNDLNIYNNNQEAIFSVLDPAFNYARENQCELRAEIIYNDGINPPAEASDYGQISGDKAILEILPTEQFPFENQYAAVYCVHQDDKETSAPNDRFREILASYHLRDYYDNQNGRALVSTQVSSKSPVIPPFNNRDGQISLPATKHSTSSEPPALEIPPRSYEPGSNNADLEYHLRTDCGEPKEVISSNQGRLPMDKWGIVEVELDGPKTCVITSDVPEDLFNEYRTTSPNEAPLTYFLDKLEVRLGTPGFYQIIANTKKHPDKDILVFKVKEKVLPAETPTRTTIGSNDVPVSEKEDPLQFLDPSVYGEDEVNAQIFYRKTPLNRWTELKENELPTHTLPNGLLAKKAKRLLYKEPIKPAYTKLNDGKGHLFVSNIDNIKIVPKEGYELSVLKIKEETDKGMLPSNKYYFVLTNKGSGDTDVVQADVYLNKTLKKLKGATPLSIVKHDFSNRSPEFNKLVSKVSAEDYEDYLTKSYGLKAEETGVKTRLKGSPSSKEPEKRKVSTIYLKEASNLHKLPKEDGYKVELKYESLGRFGKPVLAEYENLERLLLPSPYTVKGMHNDKNSLERICAGDQELNEFLYTNEKGKKLLVELFANPEFEELKGALTSMIILGSLSGANALAPAASSSGAGGAGSASGTISGGNL